MQTLYMLVVRVVHKIVRKNVRMSIYVSRNLVIFQSRKYGFCACIIVSNFKNSDAQWGGLQLVILGPDVRFFLSSGRV